MPKGPRTQTPPSQTWRTFLKNHLTQAAAMDFFVIPVPSRADRGQLSAIVPG
jgi:hypothetical protein